jgi:hypothetical protein
MNVVKPPFTLDTMMTAIADHTPDAEFFDRRRFHGVEQFAQKRFPSLTDGHSLIPVAWFGGRSFLFEVVAYAAECPRALDSDDVSAPLFDGNICLPTETGLLIPPAEALHEYRKEFANVFATYPDEAGELYAWYRDRIRRETEIQHWLFNEGAVDLPSAEIVTSVFPRAGRRVGRQELALVNRVDQTRHRLRSSAGSRLVNLELSTADSALLQRVCAARGYWNNSSAAIRQLIIQDVVTEVLEGGLAIIKQKIGNT